MAKDTLRQLNAGFANWRPLEIDPMSTPSQPIRVPVSACPNCGKPCDSATPLKQGTTPKAGDISICFGCGVLLRFDQNLQLAWASASHLAELSDSAFGAMCIAQKEILKRLAATSAHVLAF